jgi:hypothetical protein
LGIGLTLGKLPSWSAGLAELLRQTLLLREDPGDACQLAAMERIVTFGVLVAIGLGAI